MGKKTEILFNPGLIKKQAEIKGRKLEYVLTGEGENSIVLIAGSGIGMDIWYKLFPELSKIGLVFAYDRFDIGKSDESIEPQSGSVIVEDLRQLLKILGVLPPYLLVCHSIGGLYAQIFARKYQEEVSGVLFLDATHPDQPKKMEEMQGSFTKMVDRLMRLYDRLTGRNQNFETRYVNKTIEEIQNSPTFPNIPITIITGGKNKAAWLMGKDCIESHLNFQSDLKNLSVNSKQVIAEKSGHFPQMSQPELVIEEIRKLVKKIRSNNN